MHRIGRTGRAGASGVAISFVSHSDQRLVVDLEKLLKSKINLEAVEFEEDRPRERINKGRRAWGEDDPRDVLDAPRESREPRESSGRGRGAYAGAPRVAHDPFFDKPYEPSNIGKPVGQVSVEPLRKSSNIKSKRKVAALFKSES